MASIEEARALAMQLLAALGDESQNTLTVCELFEQYMSGHGSRKRSAKRMRQLFNRHLKHFSRLNASQVKGQDVVKLHDEIGAKTGRATANRVIEILRAAYNRGIKRGTVTSNPCAAVTMFKLEERDRYLSGKDEIDRFLKALDTMKSRTFQSFIKTCLFTAARVAAVQAMEWSQLDLDQRVWRIPPHNSKSGKPVLVPLIDEALQAIEGQRGKHARWVFPGRGKTGHLVNPARAWGRLLVKAKIENLRMHDLRRTMGSWQANTNASLKIIQQTLGHTSQRATHIYARLQIDPVRDAMVKATAAMLQKRID